MKWAMSIPAHWQGPTKAVAAARDELQWRQAQKANGATTPRNLDFW